MIRIAGSKLPEERRHTIVVGAGLYLLRYASTPSTDEFPSVAVNQHPNNRNITLMSAPGGSDTHLFAPGDCMVVRATAPGSLSLVVSSSSGDSIDAELKLEKIVSSPADEFVESAPKAASKANGGAAGHDQISVMAHVSRRGDVIAEPGEWICGPDLPLPIEGVEIGWTDRPAGVDLAYTVTAGRALQRPFSASVGEFAGTRGKAMSLVGVSFALTGPMATEYELRAEALFLGAAISSQNGRRLSFAGPSGLEPLVGLKLEVVKFRERSMHDLNVSKPSKSKQVGKVRVYRPAGAAIRPAALGNQ